MKNHSINNLLNALDRIRNAGYTVENREYEGGETIIEDLNNALLSIYEALATEGYHPQRRTLLV
jgi:hypothetical protein